MHGAVLTEALMAEEFASKVVAQFTGEIASPEQSVRCGGSD
jgi:hypothetical protein